LIEGADWNPASRELTEGVVIRDQVLAADEELSSGDGRPGELTFWIGGEVTVAAAGSFVYGPSGVAHTFIVSSEDARFLLVAEPAGFEGFTRARSLSSRLRHSVVGFSEQPPRSWAC
jgi:hypothetical protein